jgi:hypothetical protein
MSNFNYDKDDAGEWVFINPVRADDGFGNIIINAPKAFMSAVKFITDGRTSFY